MSQTQIDQYGRHFLPFVFASLRNWHMKSDVEVWTIRIVFRVYLWQIQQHGLRVLTKESREKTQSR